MKKFLSIIILITGSSVASKEDVYFESTPIGQFRIDRVDGNINSESKYGFSYGMSLSNNSYQICQDYSYVGFGIEDFKKWFSQIPEEDVLRCYDLYKYPNFREYARSLPGYDHFMKILHERIKTDKKTRNATFQVQGFGSSFGFRSQKSGFQDFIANEVRTIEKLEELTKAYYLKQQVQNLSNNWLHKQENVGSNFDYNKRLDNRIQAAEKFMNGDKLALDKQLRSEVSEIQNRVTTLEKNYSHDRYVQFLTPLVRACAARAIAETCPLIDAFQLTDFSYVITDVLFQGMGVLYDASCAVAKGATKGAATVASIDHWKGMVTSTLQLAGMCLEVIGREALSDASYMIGRSPADSDVIMKFAQQNSLEMQQNIEAFQATATESYNKLKLMPWQEVVENGAEIGTTMILETLVLNVAVGCVGSANKAFINKISNLTESGAIFTEQYAAEVAGFGKLMLEGGPECATKVTDAVKKELITCMEGQSAAQQARRVICSQKWLEEIAHKICNVGDDILDIMEKLGGHTLEKHVGKPYDYLRKRVSNTKKGSATTFTNKRTAIDAVKENLKQNVEKISLWFTNELEDELICEMSHAYSVGKGVFKAKKNPCYDLNSSKMLLRKDNQSPLGFRIVTAFPI